MKRVLLFLATNFAVMAVLLTVASLLGVNQYLNQNGLDLKALAGFSLIFGFGGAFISLLMSKQIAKWSMKVQVIKEPRTAGESWLVATVRRQAEAAGIGMPEVGIFEAPEPNAFATGANKNNALVAVSTGLLQTMRQEEVEAVLGHEISHVTNGDMVTLTLIQGVVNTFVIFAARVIGYLIDKVVLKNDRGTGAGYYMTVMVLDILFGVLAMLIVAWFSRQREFRADAGGARLAGKPKMVAALQRLAGAYGESTLPKQVTAFGINGGFKSLFATHPPIEQRIARLQQSA
ncbi:MAG TPA: protease HtpX [Verrucomicrobiae bacterium]|nr:protease HtpX [Verrucomicrobiae bacterium]